MFKVKGGDYMKNTKTERIIEMIKDFQELSRDDQIYVSGIVKGIYLQKQSIEKEQQSA